MVNTTEKKIYVDSNIPLEHQIVFLRKSLINFQYSVFEILKEKFGSAGIEIFKTIMRQRARQGIDKIKDKSFEEIKNLAGLPDRILGFQITQDYIRNDEFQYSITFCPYFAESKRRGMSPEFCNILEEVEIEEVSRNLGELAEPTRMCQGDSKCTVRIRNTLGK